MGRSPVLALGLASVLAASALGCAGDSEMPAGRGLTLRDPQDLLDDVVGPLRLLAFAAETYACDPATGTLAPDPADAAEIDGTVVDIRFETAAGATIDVRPGSYSLLVRGRGTDVVSGRMDVIIATGCVTESIADGETREVSIELHPIVGEGVCGDGVLSPDEQCEDAGTVSGDGCSDTCRTEPFLVSRPPGGAAAGESLPATGWAEGSRLAVVYDSAGTNREVNMMLFDDAGAIITAPTALQLDAPVEILPAVQTAPAAAVGGGRVALAFADFQGTSMGGDVRVRFFDRDRNAAGPSVLATADSTGVQTDPAIASMGDGTTLVVFADARSATGLGGRLFAAGATTPSGSTSFEVGAGTTGGGSPAVAARPTGFVVAFAAGGDVFVQRFGADGTAEDAMAVPVPEDMGGTQDQPSVAALDDGTFMAVWHDASGIGARVFADDGSPVTPGFRAQAGAGAGEVTPAVAAGRGRFVVAWQRGGEIRARIFGSDGSPALNRDPVPTTGETVLATGAVSEPAVAAGGTRDRPKWFVAYRDTAVDPMGDIQGRLFALP